MAEKLGWTIGEQQINVAVRIGSGDPDPILMIEEGVDLKTLWLGTFWECNQAAFSRAGWLIDETETYPGKMLIVRGGNMGKRIGEPDLPEWVGTCVRGVGTNKTLLYTEAAAKAAIRPERIHDATEEQAHEWAHILYFNMIETDTDGTQDINWLKEGLAEIAARDQSRITRVELKNRVERMAAEGKTIGIKRIAKEGLFAFDNSDTPLNTAYQYSRRFVEEKFLPELERIYKEQGIWDGFMEKHKLQAVHLLLFRAYEQVKMGEAENMMEAIEKELAVIPGTVYIWEEEWKAELIKNE